MSRYNRSTLSRTVQARTPNIINLAGGSAFAQDAELELASLVTTNMQRDQFYRSADDGLVRMRELLTQVDPYYAAQAAVYARTTDGVRSITHALAAELAHNVKGEQWTKRFFDRVVRRPDDATEILAYYMAQYGKPVPNAMKKGLGLALGKFDEYQLAKYRGDKHGLSLVDAVNMVHPTPTAKNRSALQKLVAGQLRSVNTFEAKLSAAGSNKAAKEEAWADLVESGTIGYMALLKNLRNIAEQAPKLVPQACKLLTNEKQIRQSLVLPFRFVTAMTQLRQYPTIMAALSDAVDLSLGNIPALGNDILIAVDGSGSMSGPVAGNPDLPCKYVGSLFAAALFKKNHAEVCVFGDTCGPVSGLNPRDSTLTIAEKILRTSYGYSTNFHSIFTNQHRGHDTVVIFSDMQAWVGSTPEWNGYLSVGGYLSVSDSLADYRRRFKRPDTKVFAFDLTGYGTTQFPEKDVFQIAGFSDDTLSLMAKLREDPRALVTAIKQVEI